jgi:hypothetical protein
MSLVVNLAVLAEGATTDARGNLTLVAVNPQVLVADELPAQFSPIFVMVVEDDETESPSSIMAGRIVTAKIEATGPDSSVVFFTQLRQAVMQSSVADLRGRVQLLAQIPFTAPKIGIYTVSAEVTFSGGNETEDSNPISAKRSVRVADLSSLRAKSPEGN